MALADMTAGLYGAMAVLIALREREVKGGAGQVIDLSLLEPVFSILGADAAGYRIDGSVKQRVGSASNTASPRNVYATKDGKWVALSASIQSMAERVFQGSRQGGRNRRPPLPEQRRAGAASGMRSTPSSPVGWPSAHWTRRSPSSTARA